MLSARDISWLNRAMEKAISSDCKQSLGAIVLRAGNPVGEGYNSTRNVHIDASAIENSSASSCWTTHAEAAAIRKVSSDNLRGATLYVARRNNQGAPRMARPCSSCKDLIKTVGITRIVYTTNNEPVAIRTRDL